MNTYETEKLANGLRIIYEPSATEVVYCGYVVNAGTRHEPADREGMAHFIEHMSFKGTEHRSSWHVSNALESVGGDLNAYTSKEETVFYTALPREELKRAIDVLTDMVFHSTYPQCEIDKEVEVIIDEIQSYKDSPSDLIFDEFEETIFKNHALGRKILGKAERLRTFTTADALAFTGKCYRPSNATFFLYGNIDFGRAVRMLEHATAGLSPLAAEKSVTPLPEYEPVERIVEKGTHQAHVIIGTRGLSANDKRKTPLFLLRIPAVKPQVIERYQELFERMHFDVVVNSVHFVNGWDVYFPNAFFFKSRRRMYGDYLDLVLKSLDAPYEYDIVAHIGYVTRNAPYKKKVLEYADFPEKFDAILHGIIERGKALEVNTHTSLFPTEEILRKYYDYGGRKLSFGSDSHHAELCKDYERTCAMLRGIGFTHFSVFSAHREELIPI